MSGRAALPLLRSALAVLVVTTWGGPARAQEPAESAQLSAENDVRPRLALSWNGPADCERGEAVRAKILRLLGARPEPSLEVSVTVRREAPTRYVALLETSTEHGVGSKRLEGESCEAIALASSVVIALSIDPNASLDAEPSAEPPPRPLPPRAPPPPRPAPPAPREVRPYLHGSIGVLSRLLSAPSAFTSAGIGARFRRFSLELAGAVYQPRDVALVERSQVGAELRLFTAELLGCYAAVPFALGAVELCPGLRAEYMWARSFGVTSPDEAQVLLGSGLLVLRGRLRPTPWLSATLDAGLAARPFHPTFVLIGVGDVFEIPLVSPFARTGLALEF